MLKVYYQHEETGNIFDRYYSDNEPIEIFPRYFECKREVLEVETMIEVDKTEAVSINYEEEYYRQCEHMKKLVDENEKLKDVLLKLALRL